MANLTITLPEEQWASMLNLLTDHPFKQVAPLIHQIQRQLQTQLESTQEQRGNGANMAIGPGAQLMASAIDITKPVYGNPSTQSVRDNFSTASNEITTLQTDVSNRVSKLGDVMDGFLTLYGDPQLALHAANRSWVINQIRSTANAIIYVGDYDASIDRVLTSGQSSIAINQPLPAATSGNAQMYFTVKVGKAAPSIGNQPPGGVPVGSWLISNGTSWNIYQPSAAGVIAQTVPVNPEIAGLPGGTVYAALQSVPQYYLPLVGGTITGLLNLTQTPTLPGHAATKGYVDSTGVTSFNTRTGSITLTTADVTAVADATYVNLTGDTMTGQLIVTNQFRVSGIDPRIQLYDSNTSLNQKYIDILGSDGSFLLQFVDDAFTTGSAFMQVSRNGIAPQVMTLTSPTINLAGSVTATGTITSNSNISGAGIYSSAGIFQIAPNFYLARNSTDGYWRFVENGVVNATIDTGGWIQPRLGIMVAPQQQLRLYWDAGTSQNVIGHFSGFYWASRTADYTYAFWSQSVERYSMRNASTDFVVWYGPCFATAFPVISDERLKDEIQQANFGLKEIIGINPITYYHSKTINPSKKSYAPLNDPKPMSPEEELEAQRVAADAKSKEWKPRLQLGFSAQQVQESFPQAVVKLEDDEPDSSLAIDTSAILSGLVNAVKELHREIEAIKRQRS